MPADCLMHLSGCVPAVDKDAADMPVIVKDAAEVPNRSIKPTHRRRKTGRYVVSDLLGIDQLLRSLSVLTACFGVAEQHDRMMRRMEVRDPDVEGDVEEEDEEDEEEEEEAQWSEYSLDDNGEMDLESESNSDEEGAVDSGEPIELFAVSRNVRAPSSNKQHNFIPPVNMVLMHASPLMLHDYSVVSHQDASDYAGAVVSALDSEIDTLRKARRDVNCEALNLSFKHMTLHSLAETLTLFPPHVMHLSGHGTYDHSGQFVLALEGETGAAEMCSMTQLDRLLSMANVPALVFLGVCHSEPAGRLFVRHGAKHVVACRSGGEYGRVLDMSARCFMKFFWTSLFQGSTVREAFRIAATNVDVIVDGDKRVQLTLDPAAASGVPESRKFVLLPEDGDHDVRLFPFARTVIPRKNKQLESDAEDCDAKDHRDCDYDNSQLAGLPPQTENFVGRQKEVQQCVGLLNKHRCVGIYGPRRFGKTSVAKRAAQYVCQRAAFTDGVVFVDLKHANNIELVLERLTTVLSSTSRGGSEHELDGDDDGDNAILDTAAEYAMRRFTRLLHSIAYLKVLLVLDDCGGAFGQFVVRHVLKHTVCARVLTTSTNAIELPVEDGSSCGLVCVRELSMQACFKLMYLEAPWMFRYQTSTHNENTCTVEQLAVLQQQRVDELEQFCRSCRLSPYLLRVGMRSWSSSSSSNNKFVQ